MSGRRRAKRTAGPAGPPSAEPTSGAGGGAEPRPAERGSADSRSAEPRSSELRSSEPGSAESRSAEPRPSAPKPPVPGPPKTATIPIVVPPAAEPGGDERPRGRSRRRGGRRRRRGSRLPDRAIVLVGPMAAGKTSLGKRVARELAIPFVDSDALIVRQHGPITDIFAQRGEDEFRRIEAEIIAAELARPGARVLALGGGAVLTASTRELLRHHPVVLLMTTQEAVLRTVNVSRRPLLRDDPSAWGRILEERRPLYEEVASVTYRTDRATKEQLARRVAQWARGWREGEAQ